MATHLMLILLQPVLDINMLLDMDAVDGACTVNDADGSCMIAGGIVGASLTAHIGLNADALLQLPQC